LNVRVVVDGPANVIACVGVGHPEGRVIVLTVGPPAVTLVVKVVVVDAVPPGGNRVETEVVKQFNDRVLVAGAVNVMVRVGVGQPDGRVTLNTVGPPADINVR